MNEKLVRLKQKDPILGQLIDKIGELNIQMLTDPYVSLTRTIIGQLISVKAAESINSRFVKLLDGKITPENVLSHSDDDFRNIGLSRSKIACIKDLSNKVMENEIALDTLDKLSDDEVIATLTTVKGIGKWTGEMFLILSLGRENVLSILDVGLQRGAKWLYNSDDGKAILAEKGQHWAPYQSIASLYLWEVVTRGLIREYSSFEDYLQKQTN